MRTNETSKGPVSGPQSASGSETTDDLKRQARRTHVLLVLAFFALSVNLRASLTSLPPIIQDLKVIFHIDEGFAGFLTSIPVLCFGLLTPLVGFLMKNIRLETTIFLTLAGIALGSVVRAMGGIDAAVAGTVVIGAALTAGNIAGLLVIGREFPNYISAMTGLCVCGMSVGSMGTMALTAPMAHALGWRFALASPALLAVAAVGLWIAALFSKRRETRIRERLSARTGTPPTVFPRPGGSARSAAPSASVLRRPVVWILAVAFAAHTFLFYGLTSWMPLYLEQTLGMSDATAGAASSSFQILGLLGCFGIPLLAGSKRFSPRALFLAVTLSWCVTVAGFWFLPEWWAAWVLFGGVGSGGGFTVVFSTIMKRAESLDENRTMSTVVQTGGYIVASLGPFAVGHLHEIFGTWHGGMALLAGASVVMTLSGLAATGRTGTSS